MSPDAASLPDDIAFLKAMLVSAGAELEQLRMQVARLRRLGEDVTEQPNYVPVLFRGVRHVWPRLSCRSCERIVQAPLSSLPIERGRPGAGLLAHVLVQIRRLSAALPALGYLRALGRRPCPLHTRRLGRALGPAPRSAGQRARAPRHGGATLHADDTPVPVLPPMPARLWTYVRDECGAGRSVPPAVLFRYAPDRKGERPTEHLVRF